MNPLPEIPIESVQSAFVDENGNSASITFNMRGETQETFSIPYETIGMLQTVLAQLRKECTKRRINEPDKPITAHMAQGVHGKSLPGNDLTFEIYTVDKIPFHFVLSRHHAAGLYEIFSNWKNLIEEDGLPLDKQIH